MPTANRIRHGGRGKTTPAKSTSYPVKGPSPTTNAPTTSGSRTTKPGSTTDPYLQAQKDAQAKADAKEAEAKRKAGQTYLERAGLLEPQIRALQLALSDEGFKAALDQNLADLLGAFNAGIDLLKEGNTARAQTFLETAADTEKATAQHQGSAFENLVRERQDTMTNLMQHGAGETDALRSMVMAARQFHDNEAEGNRAYFDTMRSVKGGLADLNYDTRSAMQNAALNLESERDRLWQGFYNQRSETFTQLGNLYGQQGEYYAQANEMDVGSGGKDATARTGAENAFMDASREAAKSYAQQGVPSWIREWKGIEAPEARQSNTDLAAAVQFQPIQQAEGASLRTW